MKTKNALDKKEQTIQLLMNEFKARGELSTKDIMQLLNINSRQSIYNYLGELEKRGWQFRRDTRNRITYFIVSPNQAETMHIAALKKGIFYRFILLYELRKMMQNDSSMYIDASKLRARFYYPDIAQDENSIEVLPSLGIMRNRFYTLIHEMIAENLLITPSKKVHGSIKIRPSETAIKPMLFFDDSEQMEELFYSLSSLNIKQPYYKQLASVQKKIAYILGEQIENAEQDNFIYIGRTYSANQTLYPFIKKISTYNYQENAITVTYHTTKDGIQTKTIGTAMIVHSLEKDNAYLMGPVYKKEIEDYEENAILIKIERIISITPTNIKNPYYKSNEFISIFEEMFSISTEATSEIEVLFDSIFQIPQKVQLLARKRLATANIAQTKEKIRYKDTVRGLSDVSAYLRRFGRSCQVVEPPILKNYMRESILRTLDRYGESYE